jgi:hypothetical protein
MRKLNDFTNPLLDSLSVPYDEGRRDGAMHKPIDDCRYRNQAKRSAYETGWHAGRRAAEETDHSTRLTPEESARAKAHIANLRSILAEFVRPYWAVRFNLIDTVEHLWLPKEYGRSACGEAYWPTGRAILPAEKPTERCPKCAKREAEMETGAT